VGHAACDPFLTTGVTCHTDPWNSVSSMHIKLYIYGSAAIIAYVVVNATTIRTRPLLSTYLVAGKLHVCLCHFTYLIC
jgi:hypothetical protein